MNKIDLKLRELHREPAMLIARIDEEVISANDFVKLMRLEGVYETLIDKVLANKLTVHAAKKLGISVTAEEIQKKVDQIRRIEGLHRAKDTHAYLDAMGVTPYEYGEFVTEMLYKEKLMDEICTDDVIEEYFNLHSPQFDSVDISHMLLDSEGKAREMMAHIAEDPKSFPEMAMEYSLSDNAANGGVIGRVRRGAMPDEIETKVFNASRGDVVGPFPTADGLLFEIFMVNDVHPATLDSATKTEVEKVIYDQWLEARAQEHLIEAL